MRPAKGLLAGLGAWVLVGLATSLQWLPLSMWAAVGVILLVLASIDGRRLQRSAVVTITREAPSTFALGEWYTIKLDLRLDGRRSQHVYVHDGHPGRWPTEHLPQAATLDPGRETRVTYRIRAIERGVAQFGQCEVRVYAQWRFWHRQYTAGSTHTVRVYPNFAPLTKFALLNAARISRITGAHVQPRRGQGTDFHQLREFRIGDSLRQVDWKASQRLRRPISREYQEEQNQQIILLLDTGRRLLARDGELSHFDHVLNAVLVLGYLALRQGDAVGLLTSGASGRWLPPQRGARALNTLMHTVYDLQATQTATDYLALATELAARQKRRALVMLISNLRDEDTEDVMEGVQLLTQRHIVCIASLRESALSNTLDQPIESLDNALLAGGVAHFLAAREHAHRLLRGFGIPVMDVTCNALPAALTETYLAVKRAERL